MSHGLPDKVTASTVRYIKLGPGNAWFESCMQHQRIELGHAPISHEIALAGDWNGAIAHYVDEQGRKPGTAKNFVREATDFYTLGRDCLWITFADGCLWWAFSEPKVTWLGGDGARRGVRARPTLGPWRNTTVSGELLRQSDLSTRLTQVAAYRQTLCQVKDRDYVVRKINDEVEPIVAEAKAAESALIDVANRLIARLHWADFELLVDLIFSHTGWRRMSEVGGTMKDVDLAIEQPATGERAFVQVKSTADQAVFRDYLARFRSNPSYDRMFFVCHSPTQDFKNDLEDDDTVSIWSGERLATMTVKAGLFDWVVSRVA